jgi:hypothetical protein
MVGFHGGTEPDGYHVAGIFDQLRALFDRGILFPPA